LQIIGNNRMRRELFKVKETIVTVISDEEFIPIGQQEILRQRSFLENFIRRDPLFVQTLEPYQVPEEAPEIIRRMAEAASKMEVGPMASVAGAIAEYAVKAMVTAGARHVLVDNGGDIAMYLSHPVIIGIYAGDVRINNLGLRFQSLGNLFGVCTSSATVGPSLSLGRADAATVISQDVILADAAATALGNSNKEKTKKSITKALTSIANDEIEGMLAIAEDFIGMWGELPEIVKVNIDYTLITKG